MIDNAINTAQLLVFAKATRLLDENIRNANSCLHHFVP
jgi:hypothetical protein